MKRIKLSNETVALLKSLRAEAEKIDSVFSAVISTVIAEKGNSKKRYTLTEDCTTLVMVKDSERDS